MFGKRNKIKAFKELSNTYASFSKMSLARTKSELFACSELENMAVGHVIVVPLRLTPKYRLIGASRISTMYSFSWFDFVIIEIINPTGILLPILYNTHASFSDECGWYIAIVYCLPWKITDLYNVIPLPKIDWAFLFFNLSLSTFLIVLPCWIFKYWSFNTSGWIRFIRFLSRKLNDFSLIHKHDERRTAMLELTSNACRRVEWTVSRSVPR